MQRAAANASPARSLIAVDGVVEPVNPRRLHALRAHRRLASRLAPQPLAGALKHGRALIPLDVGSQPQPGGHGFLRLGRRRVAGAGAGDAQDGAIGSGGSYAQSAAKALQENTDLSPAEIVKKSLTIAAQLCIYTNHSLTIETLE